jgi:hypothetical protein
VIAKAGGFGLYEITGAKTQGRWFCAICGTTLLWQAGWWPSQTGIAGGCFTEMPLPEPTVTVSNDGRCTWLGLPTDWRTAL